MVTLMRNALAIACSAAVILLLMAPHAASQSPDGRRMYGDGVRLFEAGQYREAERLLKAAHRAAPTVGTAYYLGRTLAAMRRCSEAKPLLERIEGLLGADERGLSAEGFRRADLYECVKRDRMVLRMQHNKKRDSNELGIALMAIGFPIAGLGLAGLVAGVSSEEPGLILLGVFSGLYLMIPGTIIGIVGIAEYEPDPGPLRLPELPEQPYGGGGIVPGLGVNLSF